MGPNGHFYSCMGLTIRDKGISRVDRLSTRHPGFRGITVIPTLKPSIIIYIIRVKFCLYLSLELTD